MEDGPRSPTSTFGYAAYIKLSTESIRSRGMSTTAVPTDADALVGAIAQVRADDAGLDRKSWVLVGHVDKDPCRIDVIDQDCSAEASLEDFVSKLEDERVMYGLLRLSTTVDMSSTVKFVYIHWVGDTVPFAKKGRYGVVYGSVKDYFQPFHVHIETSNRDELTLDELVKKIEDNSMTRSKVLEVDNTAHRQERGFTQHAVKRQEKGTLRSVAPEGATIEVTPELQEAIGDVRNDKSGVTWVLAGYEDGNLKRPLTCLGKGEGDINDLKENFQDDMVMYGLYRTSDMYDDIKTVKFVYIYWVGERVKPLTKGKVSAYAGPAEKIFSPAHVTFTVTNRYEFTEDTINDKVRASSGSKSWIK